MNDYERFMESLGKLQDRGPKPERQKDSGHSPWFWVVLVSLVFVIIVIAVIGSDRGGSSYKSSYRAPAIPATRETASEGRYVTASSLNVRSSPNTGARVVGKLDFGTKVYCDSQSGDWSRIKSKSHGIEGWASSEYLSERNAMDVVLDEFRVGDKIIIPCGRLSKLPKYPGGYKFYVRMRNGSYETCRPNDIEELLLDWVFYRDRILKYHARGEYQKAAEARATFQEVNRDLDEYAESDIGATHTYLVSIGKIKE